MILAPLRGVTIRCFREVFDEVLVEAGFTEAITPFISALPGVDPLKNRELSGCTTEHLRVTPQFIGKDPQALRSCLIRIREAGYDTADLNCGCPFPMVRNKGRGSGLLRSPETLRAMLEVGCGVMGKGKFSIKARLGVERSDELLALMPLINAFPLRFLTVHARTARQMYAGVCDTAALERIRAAAQIKVVSNGDLDWRAGEGMVGRSFIRDLGAREDCGALLMRYIEASRGELFGERSILGRLKELLSYWRELPAWRRRWNVVKICRSLSELQSCILG